MLDHEIHMTQKTWGHPYTIIGLGQGHFLENNNNRLIQIKKHPYYILFYVNNTFFTLYTEMGQ